MIKAANIGSGQRRFESNPEVEWINIDCVSRPGQIPDIVCDIFTQGLPVKNLDLIMLCHVYEHWNLQQQHEAMQICFEALKPGGSVIVIVPDLKALAKRWLLGQIDDYIYTVNLMGAYQNCEGDFHRWHRTPTGLKQELELVGFSKVVPFNWRKIPGAESVSPDWWYYGLEAVVHHEVR